MSSALYTEPTSLGFSCAGIAARISGDNRSAVSTVFSIGFTYLSWVVVRMPFGVSLVSNKTIAVHLNAYVSVKSDFTSES
jgi:hypothetical protein